MIPEAAVQTSSSLLAQLADPAARALALAAAAGLALAAFRVRSTSVRLFTWTAVLYAALAMPFLGWMLPPVPVTTPEFLGQAWKKIQPTETLVGENHLVVPAIEKESPPVASERRKSATHGASRGRPTNVSEPQWGERSTLTHSNASSSSAIEIPPSTSSFSWTTIAAALYLAIAATFLARFLIGLIYGRRLIRASHIIDDPLVTRKLARRSAPRLAESELVSVPVTMGALRPTILLPADWRNWDAAKLDAVLAHELSHVFRRDPLTQRLSLLHRAIFWFSPLAWFLDRRLADLAEQASDEAALSCGTDRKHYARILLDFFEALHAAPGRVWWQGVSMAKAGQAEKRVERILSWKGSVAMRLKKSLAFVVVAFAIPVVYLAASAHPAQHVPMLGAQFTQDQTPTPVQQPAPASQAQPAAGVTGGVSAPAAIAPHAPMAGPTNPPTPALAPVAPVASAARLARIDSRNNYYKAQGEAYALAMRARSMADQAPRASYGHGYSYSYGDDDGQRFVIVTGKSDALTMSGSTADARHVEKLRKSIPGDFIWFQVDEKSYVIRDQATVDRARKLWAPQEELGKKQEELGKQQEALGKQQEALGAKMEKVRVSVPDMTAQLDKLKAELKALGATATMDQIGKIQEEMGELQEKMGDIQSHAGEQQGKLGEEMGALGEQQGKLGEEQGKLGEQQAELAEKASKEMKLLLEDAVKKGLAQPEL